MKPRQVYPRRRHQRCQGATLVSKAVVPPYPGQSEMAYIEGNAVTGPRTTGGSGSSAGGGRSEFQPTQRRQEAPTDPSRGPPRLALSVQGLPLLKPPYGTISAIDMNRGEILWQIAHGETPDEDAADRGRAALHDHAEW